MSKSDDNLTSLKLDGMKHLCDRAHARMYHSEGMKSSRQIGDLILIIPNRLARCNINANNVK